MDGIKSRSFFASCSILCSLFGVGCFIGVAKSLATYLLANLGEINCNVLAEKVIGLGIFTDC